MSLPSAAPALRGDSEGSSLFTGSSTYITLLDSTIITPHDYDDPYQDLDSLANIRVAPIEGEAGWLLLRHIYDGGEAPSTPPTVRVYGRLKAPAHLLNRSDRPLRTEAGGASVRDEFDVLKNPTASGSARYEILLDGEVIVTSDGVRISDWVPIDLTGVEEVFVLLQTAAVFDTSSTRTFSMVQGRFLSFS